MTIDRYPAALSIAGSDPSGGAGIQADLKTFATIGIYGGAAITCLTAQNTTGVSSFKPVDGSYVKEQVEMVLADLAVTHIKIGMIGTVEIARAIGEILAGFSGEVIYDPVLAASSGQTLSQKNTLSAIQEHVINHVTVLTPNIKELEALTSSVYDDADKAVHAADSLLKQYASMKAVVVKGGHLNEDSDEVCDYLVMSSPESEKPVINKAVHPRIRAGGFHGTGCTFASAFTAFHIHSGSYEESFHNTVDYMNQLISKSKDLEIGQGRSPLAHHLLCDPSAIGK